MKLECLDYGRGQGIDMPLASGTEEWTKLQLPRSITTASLDARLVHLPEDVWQRPINLDFSATSSVDIAALQHLLSLFNERGREGLDTALSIPRSREVRDLLRSWDFPAVASVAFGSSFRSLIWREDTMYIAERRRPYIGDVHARRSTNAYERLSGSRFFCFAAHVFNTDLQVESIMEAERSRWRSPLLLGYLDTCLRAAGSEIARVVIYELLVNALRRPGADLVTIVPFVDKPDQDGTSTGQLCISVWDNGKTMVDGFRTGLSSDARSRPEVCTGADRFQVMALGWAASKRRYTSDWTPSLEATDEELLLFSLFPTISRNISSQTSGMHALYRCVIDLFGGDLHIRTGNQLLNLRARSRARRTTGRTYQADLHRIGGRQFHGNLVTVRVPMKYVS